MINTLLSSEDEVLDHETFLFFKEKILSLSGINMTDRKKDLVRSRIKSYINKNNIPSFSAYRSLLEKVTNNSPEMQTFINLLTTNKTDFFREQKHFDYLIDHAIESWKKSGKKEIKIWCCASSTGEEPYTIAIVLDHHLPADIQFQILATDIDTTVLNLAKNGVYHTKKLSEIPDKYRSNCLSMGSGNVSEWFRMNDKLLSRIEFKQHNLIESELPTNKEDFDLICCRNVIIYFTPETIRTLMTKLHRALKKDGILFIGHSESIQNNQHFVSSKQTAIFSKAAV